MSFWKDLADKVSQKKQDLSEEAKRRAAKKAGEMAIETGKAAARSAVKNAGKTLDFAGKKLGEALFGPDPDSTEELDEAAAANSPPGKSAKSATSGKAPDPFAKLKAEEAARKVSTQKEKLATKDREAARAKAEQEVDDELAALKKKIRGK